MTNRLLQITPEFKTQFSIYSAAIRHPRTPRLARWLLVAAIAYLASPIDLIPDFIPVVGPATRFDKLTADYLTFPARID